MILTVLVARGSAPISRRDSLVFGGSTSCYMVRAGGETVFLDAGTELQAAPSEYTKPPFFAESSACRSSSGAGDVSPPVSERGENDDLCSVRR